MSLTTENSAIKITPAIQEALNTASADQIPVIMRQAMLDQNLVREDWDPSYLIPVENEAVPQKVGKVIRLNGVAYSLTADNEAGLLEQETAFYRTALEKPAATTETRTEPTRDASTGRFTAAEPVATVK